MVREDGDRERKRKPEERVGLRTVISEIVDHNRESRTLRRRMRDFRFCEGRDQMNRLRALSLSQIVETHETGRSGPHHALKMMVLRNAGQLLLDGILDGTVRLA